MSRNDSGKGFWSIDAAFAIVLSVAMFAIFSSLAGAAGSLAARGASEESGGLAALRFSAHAMQKMNEGEEVDLEGVLAATGRSYASLKAGDEFSSAGQLDRGAAVYCAMRIAVVEGKMARLEACIS